MDQLIALISLGIFLAGYAVVVKFSRTGASVIGYNTMTDAERATWRLPVMQRYLSVLFLFDAAWCFLYAILLATGIAIASSSVLLSFVLVFCISLSGGLIFLSNSKRFRTEDALRGGHQSE